MAKQFQNVVPTTHFQAQANVHRDADERANSLTGLIRSVLQNIAQRDVDAASVAALTDNSGGSAGATYEEADSGAFSDNDITGFTTGVLASAFNDANDTYMDAYKEITVKANEVLALLDPTSTIDEGPGGAANGTIDAITVAVTANTGNTDAVTTESGRNAQADLLHAQRTAIHAVDDVLEAVGEVRQLSLVRGSYTGLGDLTFTTGPDNINRSSGSWLTDGFSINDEVEINGTDLNNAQGKSERRTVVAITATDLEFSGTGVVAEALTTAESARATVDAVRSPVFSGRLAGGDAGPGLTETSAGGTGSSDAAGADWTLVFETGTAAITDGVDAADATSSILKTEVDALLAELANNIALLNDQLDTIVAVAAGPVGAFAAR